MPAFFSERVGGVEIQTYLISRYLSVRSWDMHFIAETNDPQKIDSTEMYDGIQVHWIQKRGLFSFFRSDISQWLTRIKPSLIYQRGRSRFTSSPIAYQYAHNSKAKLVYHCAENNDFSRHFNIREVLRSDKNILKKFVLLLHAFLSDQFFEKTIKRSGRIIAQTHEQAESFKKVYGLPSTIIPSSQEIPEVTVTKSQPPIVFWIAHAGRRKRLELFVELAKRLHKQNIKFIFAGTLPHEDYKTEIFSLMRGLTNIEYMGPLSWKDSNAMFAKAAIFINTTEPNREGFPNTYIQAWLHETPVVTLDCDPDDVIEKNGIGRHSSSFEKMADDVIELISDHDLRSNMGKKARAYAIEHHNIEKTVDELDRLFSEIIHIKE